MQKYYKAEMDRLLRILTRVAGALFVLPVGALAFVWYKARFEPSAGCRAMPPLVDRFFEPGLLFFAALIALTAYITKAMAPKGYALNDVELLIDRDLRPIRIPLSEVLEVSRPEDGIIRRSARLMGTSGYYGYYGLFWHVSLGRYRAYATRLNDLVAVKTAKGLYVLTPDDTADFIASLGRLIKR